MTSASELFTARRARAPRLSDPGDPGPDPLADAPQDPHGLAARRRRRGCRMHRQLELDQTARTVPGVLMLRMDLPIYFANSGYLHERITRWIDDDDERTSAKGETGVQYVVLDMGAVSSIDTSRTSMLDGLKKTLDRRAIQIVLANPRSEIMKKLDSSKIWSGNAQSMYHKMMVLL